MNLIEEAKKVQNGHACPKDIDLLVKILEKLDESPTVVMLGAGEVFTLTVFGARPKAVLYSIDKDPEPFNWETKSLENYEVVANHVQVLGDSVEVAKSYKGPKIDLLIIDSDHSLEGVTADIKAWSKHLNSTHYMFFHDYDANDAPYYYAGVKEACDKHFTKKPLLIDGWSAVFDSKKPVKKTVKKTVKKVAKK